MARNVTIKFLGDDSDLNRATNSATKDLDRFSKHAGMVGGIAAGVTTAALNAVASAARGVASFVGGAISEAEDAARVGRVTAQIIETTGKAAKVSAQHVADLSEAIGETAGVDDELVQSAANVLLTFKQVRNETGKGNKIFDRAMKSAADLSAVLGTDMKASTLQLGKALSNPVKGITALQRAGVNFTDSQKEMIKSLVESGDVLGAQRIILGEVESQVGGAAEANATASQRMRVAWDNFKESIGTAILPVVEKITGWLIDTALPAVETFTDKTITLLSGWARFVRDAFTAGMKGEGAIKGIDSLATAVGWLAEKAGAGFTLALDHLKELGKWAQENRDALEVVAAGLAGVGAALVTIGAANKAAGAVQGVVSMLGGVVGALGPWGLVAVLIIALGAAAVVAYQKFKPFRDFVDETWRIIKQGAEVVIAWFQSTFVPAWQQISDEVRQLLDALAAAFAAVWEIIRTQAEIFMAIFRTLWRVWGDNIMQVVSIVWGFVRGAIESALRIIAGIINVVTGLITGDWSRAWEGIKQIVSGVTSQVINLVQTMVRLIGQAVGGVGEVLLAPFRYFADNIGKVLGGIAGIVGGIFDGIKRVFTDAINALIRIINTAIRAYNKIPLAPDIDTIGEVGRAAPTGTAAYRMQPVGTRALGGMRMAPMPVSAGRTIVVNLPSGVNGHSVIDAVRRYESRNGSSLRGWRRSQQP